MRGTFGLTLARRCWLKWIGLAHAPTLRRTYRRSWLIKQQQSGEGPWEENNQLCAVALEEDKKYDEYPARRAADGALGAAIS